MSMRINSCTSSKVNKLINRLYIYIYIYIYGLEDLSLVLFFNSIWNHLFEMGVFCDTGRGLQGIMITGCAETFQSFQESQQGQQQQQGQQEERQQGQQGEQQGQQRQQGQQGQRFRGDQHQKIRDLEEGDVMVVPIGTGHFIFNNGGRRLVVVSVLDISNDDNQLDVEPRVRRVILS